MRQTARVRLDPIDIEGYDATWPELFADQQLIVTSALSDLLIRPIEHVGSTAVPGLPAKPIIDMLAIVECYQLVIPALPRLASVDWILAPEPSDDLARKLSLCHPTQERRSHHLHIVELNWGWQDLLLYRDYLRTHSEVAARYGALKRTLAAVDDKDRPRYRAGKAPFIHDTLADARIWQAAERPPG